MVIGAAASICYIGPSDCITATPGGRNIWKLSFQYLIIRKSEHISNVWGRVIYL